MIGELLERNKNEENRKYSIIHWQTGEPKERGVYLVTYQFELSPYTTALFYISGVWLNGDWLECPKRNIKAWCKLSDIKPYTE